MDAAVAGVCDVDVPTGADRHADGAVELSWPRTRFTPLGHRDELLGTAGEKEPEAIPDGDGDHTHRDRCPAPGQESSHRIPTLNVGPKLNWAPLRSCHTGTW